MKYSNTNVSESFLSVRNKTKNPQKIKNVKTTVILKHILKAYDKLCKSCGLADRPILKCKCH